MVVASSLSTTNDLLRKSNSSPYQKQGGELLQRCIDDPRLRKYFLPKEPAILPDPLPGKPDRKKVDPKKPV
jgi:hypothetical protein